MSGWWWLAFFGVIVWLWRLARAPARSAPPGMTRSGSFLLTQPAGLKRGTAGFIQGSGHFDYEIVGEYYNQEALERVMRVRPVRGLRQEFTALIVPENDNPHDGLAVRIEINGETVGHLAREEARAWRDRLKQAGYRGKAMACRARVVAEAPRFDDEDDWTFQVYLDVD